MITADLLESTHRAWLLQVFASTLGAAHMRTGRLALCLAVVVSAVHWPAACTRDLHQDEDISGPSVRGVLDLAPSPLADALLAGVNLTEKKTIAQIIDEALEQEFPEEKQEGLGKNYNETREHADVSAMRRNMYRRRLVRVVACCIPPSLTVDPCRAG